jgi:hypothetical protein
VLFPAWDTFYVIFGSSAGALTGLMFVVIALVADFGGSEQSINAFGTPTVVHFGASLMLSVLMVVPWPGVLPVRMALGAFGAAGIVYMILVLRRARQQSTYQPVFEDWMFHTILPAAAYAATLASAGLLSRETSPALFAIAGAGALLMFVGIHNAWDTVTFIVISKWERAEKAKAGTSGPPQPGA